MQQQVFDTDPKSRWHTVSPERKRPLGQPKLGDYVQLDANTNDSFYARVVAELQQRKQAADSKGVTLLQQTRGRLGALATRLTREHYPVVTPELPWSFIANTYATAMARYGLQNQEPRAEQLSIYELYVRVLTYGAIAQLMSPEEHEALLAKPPRYASADPDCYGNNKNNKIATIVFDSDIAAKRGLLDPVKRQIIAASGDPFTGSGRDPVNNYGLARTDTSLRMLHVCCGQRYPAVGCWIPTTARNQEPFKPRPYRVFPDADEITGIWEGFSRGNGRNAELDLGVILSTYPKPGTAWLNDAYYAKKHEQIANAWDQQLQTDISDAFRAYFTVLAAFYGNDGRTIVPLPHDSLPANAVRKLRKLAIAYFAYNRVHCTGEQYPRTDQALGRWLDTKLFYIDVALRVLGPVLRDGLELNWTAQSLTKFPDERWENAFKDQIDPWNVVLDGLKIVIGFLTTAEDDYTKNEDFIRALELVKQARESGANGLGPVIQTVERYNRPIREARALADGQLRDAINKLLRGQANAGYDAAVRGFGRRAADLNQDETARNENRDAIIALEPDLEQFLLYAQGNATEQELEQIPKTPDDIPTFNDNAWIDALSGYLLPDDIEDANRAIANRDVTSQTRQRLARALSDYNRALDQIRNLTVLRRKLARWVPKDNDPYGLRGVAIRKLADRLPRPGLGRLARIVSDLLVVATVEETNAQERKRQQQPRPTSPLPSPRQQEQPRDYPDDFFNEPRNPSLKGILGPEDMDFLDVAERSFLAQMIDHNSFSRTFYIEVSTMLYEMIDNSQYWFLREIQAMMDIQDPNSIPKVIAVPSTNLGQRAFRSAWTNLHKWLVTGGNDRALELEILGAMTQITERDTPIDVEDLGVSQEEEEEEEFVSFEEEPQKLDMVITSRLGDLPRRGRREKSVFFNANLTSYETCMIDMVFTALFKARDSYLADQLLKLSKLSNQQPRGHHYTECTKENLEKLDQAFWKQIIRIQDPSAEPTCVDEQLLYDCLYATSPFDVKSHMEMIDHFYQWSENDVVALGDIDSFDLTAPSDREVVILFAEGQQQRDTIESRTGEFTLTSVVLNEINGPARAVLVRDTAVKYDINREEAPLWYFIQPGNPRATHALREQNEDFVEKFGFGDDNKAPVPKGAQEPIKIVYRKQQGETPENSARFVPVVWIYTRTERLINKGNPVANRPPVEALAVMRPIADSFAAARGPDMQNARKDLFNALSNSPDSNTIRRVYTQTAGQIDLPGVTEEDPPMYLLLAADALANAVDKSKEQRRVQGRLFTRVLQVYARGQMEL